MTSLLQLPAELQAEILCFVATSKQPGQQIRDLISAASTCRAWYHAVFCSSHDHIWRTIAIALGVSPSLRLDQILYPGSSALQPRRWINVVRLNFCIKKPFPHLPPGLPPITRAQSAVPRPDSTENWRRTVELMVAGEGSQKHASYTTRHANCKDGGSAVFTVSDPEVMGGRQMLCIYDATRNRTDIVHSEPWVPSGPTPTKYPPVVGYTMDKKHDSCGIRETFANEEFRSTWEFKHTRVGRMVSNGNTLVATAFPSEDSGRPSDIPSELMCIETDSKGISRVLWQFDASEAWEDKDAYIRYPHIKNFHMTSTHVVCLVTRHPNSQLGKLTRTEFVVLDARTGTIERTIKIDPKAAAHVGSPSNPHAPFTTAFKYDFLLTDLFIISGGPGGGLFVWDYIASDAGLLYRVPGPWVLGSLPELPRQYSNITMSSDGRFIAATTSNQLLMFDLVNKTLCGAYSNGRRVKAQYQYVSNPSDDFAGGIWCLMRDWTGVRDEASGAVSWKETESSSRNGGVVAYVTALPDECTAKVRYASMHQAFSVLPTMLDFCRRPGAFVVVLVGVIIGIVLRQWGSGEQRGSGYKVLHVQ